MAPTEAPAPATEPGGDAEDSAKGEQVKAQVMSLSKEDREQVGKGQGLLEIVAGRDDKVFVNGTLAGHGPVVKKAVKAVDEPYEIRVKLQGEERVNYVVVEEGKRMRLRVAPPWR